MSRRQKWPIDVLTSGLQCLLPAAYQSGQTSLTSTTTSFFETMIQTLSSRLKQTYPFCPIAKLPIDLLIEIFQTTCESTRKITPLLFGGICKDWRRIAWSTPLLWSTVSVKVSKRPSQVDLLREWLLRARSTPLSIYLTLDAKRKTTPDSFRTVFKLLITRAEYWRTFDCFLPTSVAECREMTFQHEEFPSLTSLSLRSTKSYPAFPAFSTFLTMFLVPPRLERIELSWYDLRECNLDAFSLEQLRCFKMEDVNITDIQVLALLRSARALQECYFNIIDVEDPTPSASPTLHTQLELLHVVDPSHFFLDNLTLPKLRVLTVHNSESFLEGPFSTAISSLVLRSSCHLERLTLEQYWSFNLKDDILITLLEALPSLNHLDITCFDHEPEPSEGLTDKLVSRLWPLGHGSCLLSRLTSLTYQGPLPCARRLLVDMLSVRWRRPSGSEGGEGVSRLIRANIVSYHRSHIDTPDDILADIEMLVDEGMEVEIQILS